jgi:hypothetical protein
MLRKIKFPILQKKFTKFLINIQSNLKLKGKINKLFKF